MRPAIGTVVGNGSVLAVSNGADDVCGGHALLVGFLTNRLKRFLGLSVRARWRILSTLSGAVGFIGRPGTSFFGSMIAKLRLLSFRDKSSCGSIVGVGFVPLDYRCRPWQELRNGEEMRCKGVQLARRLRRECLR